MDTLVVLRGLIIAGIAVLVIAAILLYYGEK
jgi:hypothetical protein